MSVKNLFIATGIVCLFFGIMLVFCQDALAKTLLTDPTHTANSTALSYGYGVLLISIGLAVFAARNSVPSAARRGYLIQITLSGLATAGFDIHDIMSGVCKSAQWGTVAIVGLLGLWGLAKLLTERSATA
ncbi:MAG TPA: hypothetical protein VG367_04765 [Mucilaginibacter sp.]|jgi:hypothetical protein|nr:hypothetical protein [Mucilaginibacter sp.]